MRKESRDDKDEEGLVIFTSRSASQVKLEKVELSDMTLQGVVERARGDVEIVGGDAYGGALHGDGVELLHETAPTTGFYLLIAPVLVQVDIERQCTLKTEIFNPLDVIPVEDALALQTEIVNLQLTAGDDHNRRVADVEYQLSKTMEDGDVSHENCTND